MTPERYFAHDDVHAPTDSRGPAEILDTLTEATSNDCEPLARAQYQDAVYEGLSQIFTDCGGLETGFAWIAVEPSDGDAFTAVVGVQIVTDADVEAYERILATFIVG